MTFTHALATNNYGPAKWIVDASAANGTHTTIAAALTSASSGDTIFIRPGTFTENLTLKAGVNLTAFVANSSLNNTGSVKIIGKATFTGAGTVTISGIELQTNSDFFLAVTGSAASIVNLNNCYLNCSNNTGISFTTSSGSGLINIYYCTGDLGTTGIAFHSSSSAGAINYFWCNLTNSGASTTITSNSAGTSFYFYCNLACSIGTTSTGAITVFYSNVDNAANNGTALTANGTGNGTSRYSAFSSGTASAITIGAGAAYVLQYNAIGSSNTNAVTGAGSVTALNNLFSGTSAVINTTTQTLVGGAQGIIGSSTTPTLTSFLGQQISNSASSVATSNGVAKTITSISITPGIWDVSGIASAVATGGTAVIVAQLVGISTTDNTITGTLGQDYVQLNIAAAGASGVMSGTVPVVRVVVNTNTTYYLVVQNSYTSTTCPTNARITATRVG